jgi:predicted transcriptional regulator of viral defense system
MNIKTNGFITTHQVVELTRITTAQGANAALGRMMKQNLIRKVRRGKHFIYELK